MESAYLPLDSCRSGIAPRRWNVKECWYREVAPVRPHVGFSIRGEGELFGSSSSMVGSISSLIITVCKISKICPANSFGSTEAHSLPVRMYWHSISSSWRWFWNQWPQSVWRVVGDATKSHQIVILASIPKLSLSTLDNRKTSLLFGAKTILFVWFLSQTGSCYSG